MNQKTGKGIKLGVTGGIGSGKTTVCRIFSVLGIPVFSADEEGKRIQDTDPEIKRQINSVVGRDLYLTGTLDRTALASLIFNDRNLLEKINSIVHPVVFGNFREWAAKQESPYSIMEVAILFESGAFRMMDRILTIITPVEERIQRIIKGNKLNREQVIERIKNQIDDASRLEKSDFVIFNSENDMVIPAVLAVHKDMLELYNKLMK
jgi:dephospho-CoA kinase